MEPPLLTNLIRMFAAWMKFVLIVAMAAQQVVGGVSCCCLTAELFGQNLSGTAVESPGPSQVDVGAKPRCSKCKSNSKSLLATESKSGNGSKIRSDGCDCQTQVRHLAAEDRSIGIQFDNQRSCCPFGLHFLMDACSTSDFLTRHSLVDAQLSNAAQGLCAPGPLLERLSQLNAWII
jgi:hypothetical protein